MDKEVIQQNLLTAKEVANLLRMPLSTVYYLSKNGTIPSVQIGRIWRFRKDEILRLIYRRGESANE
jgi:excisionase family DNA binding protein